MERQEQKIEALARMKMLGLHSNPVREFEHENKLNLSENGGILYWLEEDEQKFVDEFEKKHGGVVYHVIKTPTEFGLLYSLMYVGKHKGEWVQDRNDLKHGQALVYVVNADDDMCSEFGSIGVKPSFGGVRRTW